MSSSATETEKLGAEIAAGLEPGAVVVVSGDLGAGKTTLIRGACRALGVAEPVTSPTFTIGQRYRGDQAWVSHLDLYRLAGLETRTRPCSTTTSARTRSPSSSGRTRPPAGSGARRSRCACATAAATAAKSSSIPHPDARRRVRMGSTPCSIGRETSSE